MVALDVGPQRRPCAGWFTRRIEQGSQNLALTEQAYLDEPRNHAQAPAKREVMRDRAKNRLGRPVVQRRIEAAGIIPANGTEAPAQPVKT
jgi:hypothetical protein